MVRQYSFRILKSAIHIALVFLLTVISQIGGLVYVICAVVSKRFKLTKVKTIVFSILFYLLSIGLTSLIAPFFGRTALPIRGTIKPARYISVLLNRHYVSHNTYYYLVELAFELEQTVSRPNLVYLDANFPFFNGFPLFPHLSHNDGKKIDLSFLYRAQNDRIYTPRSFFGYGLFEAPKANEID